MKPPPSLVRFLLEAGFIVAVAAVTAVARLDKLWIALAVGAAWALVTMVERAVKNDSPRLRRMLEFQFRTLRPEPATRPQLTMEHPEPDPSAPVPEPLPPEPAPPAPDPEPPRPEPGQPTPQLRPLPSPEPEPEPERERQPPAVVPFRPRADGAPRQWNIWELERLAREQEGEDSARDEELNFLLLELRQFANADGQLPPSFDAVVREAFGDSIYSGV